MSRSPGKFVDLAAMSMSGSLMPSIPVQILLKYNPPKLTIVYHFENKENDQYFHDILFDRRMLESESDEDIVSHLYMQESYYFNPKILKRHQVKRLVQKLKSQLNIFHSSDKSPERHSIHSQGGSMGGSPSPMRGNHNQGNIKGNYQQQNLNQRQNLNLHSQIPQNNSPPFLGTNIDGIPLANRSPPRNQTQNETNGIHLNGNLANQQESKDKQKNQNNNQQSLQGQNAFQQMQQQSAFQRRKNFFERKRFLNYQAHNPMDFQNKTDPPQSNQISQIPQRNQSGSGSPTQENVNMSNFQNFQNQRMNNNNIGKQKLPPLESFTEQNNFLNQRNQGQNKQRNPVQAMHDRMPIDGNGPALNNERLQNSHFENFNKKQKQNHVNQQQFQNDMNIYDQQQNNQINRPQNQRGKQAYDNQELKNSGYPKNDQHQYNHNSQGTLNENSINDDSNLNLNDDQLLDDNIGESNLKGDGSNSDIMNNTNNGDEQVSVYMKDNVIMRRIQIEGDNREFLMDPQGQIFDMNGLFIGTANTNELEELQEDSNQNLNNQINNNENITDDYYQQNNLMSQQQEEMMLLEDDDEKY